MEPSLPVMYRILALYKQYGLGPNRDPRPEEDSNQVRFSVELGVWQAWRDLHNMDSRHAAKELLPLLRKHIDWTKVYFKD